MELNVINGLMILGIVLIIGGIIIVIGIIFDIPLTGIGIILPYLTIGILFLIKGYNVVKESKNLIER